jgi:hypothetical protein
MVSVGTITDDIHLTKVPKLMIAALHFTHAAREHILNASKTLTPNLLALQAPTSANTTLLHGKKTTWEANSTWQKLRNGGFLGDGRPNGYDPK